MADLFDYRAARQALRLFQVAHDRWREVQARIAQTRFDEAGGRDEVSLALREPAVSAIMWARSLDDWCRGLPENGKPTAPVIPGYLDKRTDVAGLLDATRYATNRSLHQLLEMMRPWGVMAFPLNPNDIFDTFRGVRWIPEGLLPPIESEKNETQRRLRVQYIEILAGRDVGVALDRLRELFENAISSSQERD